HNTLWNRSKWERWNRSKSSHSRHPVADGMAAAALLRPASPSLCRAAFMINFRATAATAALLCLTAFGASPASADGEVNVYTYRETKLVQPLFDAFTKDTGIKVNVVSASSGLEQRMKAEGASSPADV